jgi:hypothetical protein
MGGNLACCRSWHVHTHRASARWAGLGKPSNQSGHCWHNRRRRSRPSDTVWTLFKRPSQYRGPTQFIHIVDSLELGYADPIAIDSRTRGVPSFAFTTTVDWYRSSDTICNPDS